MAPPGLPSFYDPLPVIPQQRQAQAAKMTIGTSFLSLSNPAISATYPSVAAAMSPQAQSSAVQSDHDYVIKAKVEAEVEATTGFEPEPFTTDAMLSSSAPLDLETMMSDIDFTDDLADLTFSLNDLEPGEDFPMEESFQDFIDSALDKSFRSFHWESEELKAREQEQKEDYMRALGLLPVQTRLEEEDSGEMNVCDSNNNCVDNVNKVSEESTTASLSPNVSSRESVIPTKQCTCSNHSSGPRAVYTQAGQKSPDVLTTSTTQFPIPPLSPSVFGHSSNIVINNNSFSICSSSSSVSMSSGNDTCSRVGRPVIGTCLNCIQNRDVLKEFSTPLTIDVSSGTVDVTNEILQQGIHRGAFRNNEFERLLAWERQQQLQHQQQQSATLGDTEDLLQLLNANEASSNIPVDNHRVPQSRPAEELRVPHPPRQNLDNLEESFMDLEDFLNDKARSFTIPDHQPTVQHDHTYQKITTEDEVPCPAKNDEVRLRLSFIDNEENEHSEFRRESGLGVFRHDEKRLSLEVQKLRDTTLELSIPSPVSPLSSCSPYPSPDSTTRYNDSVSVSEKSQLDILNFFSDDLSANMLSAGSPLTHFRFM